MLQLTKEEWKARLEKAKMLASQGEDCHMCGGTGAWPAISHFIVCRPCGGTGLRISL
jgi:DnaJ-class molecular chaperone